MSGTTTTVSTLPSHLYSLPLASNGAPFMPGQDHISATVLLEKLKHCHTAWHHYFNDRGFHNHATHHLFALYAMGASGNMMAEAYESESRYLKPAVQSPEAITEQNFFDHFGDEKYYSAYATYFSSYLATHSHTEAIERFIFSEEFNFGTTVTDSNTGKKEKAEMLNRLLGGVIHPFIHVGYAVEFGVSGQLAEGLASAVIHGVAQTPLIPPSLFKSDFLSPLKSLSLSTPSSSKPTPRPIFALLQSVISDPTFFLSKSSIAGLFNRYSYVVNTHGTRLHELVSEWCEGWLDGATSEVEVERRLEGMVEEVVVGNVLIFGVCGWSTRGQDGAGEGFNADFFMMHLVTSSLFLFPLLLPNTPSSLHPPLSLRHRLILLHAYISTALAWYLTRARPALPILSFFTSSSTTKFLIAPPPAPSSKSSEANANIVEGAGINLGPQQPIGNGANIWNRIAQNALVHPDEHVIKVQRSLMEFGRRYGTRPPGYYASDQGVGLEGAERLDGTLFVRVAGLCAERLGWAYEGDVLRNWDSWEDDEVDV